MQNSGSICEILMLESLKYSDLRNSHSSSPIDDCCISLLTQSSTPYSVMSSLRSGISCFVFLPPGVSSGGGYQKSITKPEKNPTYQIRDVFSISQNHVPVTPVCSYIRPDFFSRHDSSICKYIYHNCIYLQGCTHVCQDHCVLQP